MDRSSPTLAGLPPTPLMTANLLWIPLYRTACKTETLALFRFGCDNGDVRGQPTLTGGTVDEVGKRLIEELQHDGRRSYAALAKTVGLSEAAVRQRVQRMVDSGLMQVVAVTDPLQVGFHRQAMIGLRVEGDLVRVADELAKIDEVDYVVITAGSFDILLELVCEDDDHLLRVLTEGIRALPGVRDTETFVYLKLAKQTYSWGTR
jgi:Lrp/AsnC family transcriptional regulator for asnA, asnC and gidA